VSAMATTAWERIQPRLTELMDLRNALSLIGWDEHVMMPPKGAEARARVTATLSSHYHSRISDPDLGEILADLREDNGLDDVQRAVVRVAAREYDRATKIPRKLVSALAETSSRAFAVWQEAKEASDFSMFEPHLREVVKLKKEEADALGWENERYDAVIDYWEPESKTAEVEAVFAELMPELAPVAAAVLDAAGPRPSFLSVNPPAAKQLAFCRWIVEQLGFDLQAGRLDETAHPFSIGIARGDTRQTIWRNPSSLVDTILSAMHESGHALYDQNFPEEWADYPIADAPSVGFHESQSRLWENHIGRSLPFIEFILPQLKEFFGDDLGMMTADDYHRAANHAERTLIRVRADEVTYNLHIGLRFELELELFRDALDVADLPDAWDAGMEKHLGIRPGLHAEGVLQDMHWSTAYFGYFSTYTLGTLYAAAFAEKIDNDLPGLDDEIRKGDFSRMLGWLRENIHHQGWKYPAKELVRRILDTDISPQPFLAHIKERYSELYNLDL